MHPLDLFHPVIREWFRQRFGTPTEVQMRGWPAIAANRHSLICAPTGSGKTLAAFLLCLDRLLKTALQGELPDSAQVVYVSPLKALSNDIHRNLELPLREIAQLARQRGLEIPEIRIALRTGDTPVQERRARARRPPHIWVTTPESLYILLTSESGRRGLAGAHTLILDEIHAVAGNKRGAHLALSMERLCELARRPVSRIGLSATVRPLEEVARFLIGSESIAADGTPQCAIIDSGSLRRMELQLEMPDMELGPIATRELWDATVARIAALSRDRGTTLVFVNTRRLAERVSHQLSQEIGEEPVATHHGSLSYKARMKTEDRLKRGELRICVATASLELGIDIGAIDRVCQIGSPRSINVLLQRVGRSGHQRGGVPQGHIFPLTRDELIECAALMHAIRRGELDRLHIPEWPLDVMAQQMVAMCAAEEWNIEALYAVLRRAYAYRHLPRAHFDAVLRMLAEGFTLQAGRMGAYVHYDGIHQMVRGRRGARLAAITSGGAIPDSADFDVVAQPEGVRVGSVHEEFAFESMAGDVFLLGNTSWRILRIEKGRVLVADAQGQAPDVPFWRGEAPARTAELSRFVSEVRENIARRGAAAAVQWLIEEVGLSAAAAAQAHAYILEGRRILGVVPSSAQVVVERFFDETGGQQLVLHAPFGARINKAWGLVLRRRLMRRWNLEMQASATDDGISLSLGPQQSFPLEDLLQLLSPQNLEETLADAVLDSPIFMTRWRWTLTRSLALQRYAGGRRVPAPLQRMRADDVRAALLPAPGPGGQKSDPMDAGLRHPLVFETLRDCFHEAMDAEGLCRILQKIGCEEIRLAARDTVMPSAFAHQILSAMPYAFLDNAPLQERRARAVAMRRALPESADDLGRLDPEAIRRAVEDAWPVVRDAEELHDAMIGWVLFPQSQMRRLPDGAAGWMEALVQSGRAVAIMRDGVCYWAAQEVRHALFFANAAGSATAQELLPIVRGWMEVLGPIPAAGLAEILDFPMELVDAALQQIEAEGLVLRGHFTGAQALEFCNRRILARIHRATIAHLRRECEPAAPALFLRFLFEWQHVTPGAQLAGESGALEIIDQLQGFEAAAMAWESDIVRARMQAYEASFLDHICLGGDVVWGRWRSRSTQAEVPGRRPGMTRTAPLGLGLREDLPWLLDAAAEESTLSASAREVLDFLRRRGASFFQEIASGLHRLPSEIEEALWQLVAAGLVTADAFSALRALVSGETRRVVHPRRRLPRAARRTREGRWSLLDREAKAPENRAEFWAHQLLRRYGILCRELLAREASAPPWRLLLSALRRLEARGTIRGGRFLDGLVGEQFALPDAVAGIRALRHSEPEGHYLKISACDPLNLVGILTPGARIAALPGNRILWRDGIPLAAVENEQLRILATLDAQERIQLNRLLDARPWRRHGT